ncbi:DNA mismatch repair endonuclease MutL [Ilyobacter polytropus]|uniref:DNA mismatch repair protein MutL n=1 Tax=Ilyobacter polytropus (strain ATCC 51220 / DSM 2926 / LMG 16218 / CuHBu1) TaxID=572544 RepID=E3H5Z3_ILYPC|nr:DNA mismatch repair endonuclease MutL [Ilyobacter polytropus]ADO82283.1 DNA mismatch repair protein MutL [Ilyobacter polytropus DSM 2926]
MGVIKILDESVSNIIAAGEVVENPASMIKEILENSLDAKSTNIRIQVKNSGRDVTISDNGVGMSKDDLLLCIERHATSKIFNKEDIFNLYTYGFRGEALASIASVSKMRITSKRESDELGTEIKALAGKVTKVSPVSVNEGTEIEIKELFYNTPARLKFLRKKSTEYGKIKETVLKESLANPNVGFSLEIDGRELLKTSGKGIQNTILELFGRNVLKNLKEFPLGFLGNLEITRSSKDYMHTYVNGRYVKSQILEKAIIDGYYTKLTKGRYPFAIIFLEIDPKEIDVNVHPSKKIVKFSESSFVYNQVFSEIEKAIGEDEDIVSLEMSFQNREKNVENFLDLDEFKGIIDKEISTPKKTPDKEHSEKEKTEEKNNEKTVPSFKEEVIKTQEVSLLDGEGVFQKKYSAEDKNIKNRPEVLQEEKKIYQSIDVSEKKPEIPEKTIEEKNYFRVIGQFMNSYIIVERNKTLEIYDQHIVQERVLYETLKKRHFSREVATQNLLVPLKLRLSYEEKNIVFENLEIFNEFGFEIEDFGDDEVLLRGVPVFDFRTSIENTFRFMLEELKNETGVKDFREKIIISMSCRNSIKAGEKLSFDEMELLIKRLHDVGKYTCPHGRPIILKVTLEELEKNFKRR